MFTILLIVFIMINLSTQFTLDQILATESQKPTLSDYINNKPMLRIRRGEGEEEENDQCRHSDNETVRIIMNRICLMCHELKAHFAPNTRVECHSNCFQNTVFQSCMKLFSGLPRKGQKDPVRQ